MVIKRIFLALLVGIVLTGCLSTSDGGVIKPNNGSGQQYAPDQLIVTFDAELDDQDVAALAPSLGVEVIRKLSSPAVWLVKITDGSSVEEAAARLTNRPDIITAEPNYIQHAN